MMRVFIAFAAVALLVSAQTDAGTEGQDGGAVMYTDVIAQHVQQEQLMARHMLELVLKMQHAQYASQAGSMYVQVYMLAQQAAAESEGDFEQQQDLEENVYYDQEDQDKYEMVDKLDMFADYYLFFANKIKLYQVISQVHDLQMEYMVVRAFQIQASYMGNQLPGGMMQMLYMRVIVTYMKTLRLSYALQVINSFTTWLEDEIDVDTAVVGSNALGFEMRASQRDELIVDKEYAFHALYTFTQLDMWIFYIEWYLEYMTASAAAPPAAAASNAAAASLLEVESTETPAQPTQTESQSKFMPYMYMYYPQYYKKFYKMYHLMFMMTAASSALQSVTAERQVWTIDNDPEANPEDADKLEDYSFQMFNMGFGSSLHSAAQLEYLTVMMEWFTFLAPMMGGAF